MTPSLFSKAISYEFLVIYFQIFTNCARIYACIYIYVYKCLHINIHSTMKKILYILESWVVSPSDPQQQQEEHLFLSLELAPVPVGLVLALWSPRSQRVLLQLTEAAACSHFPMEEELDVVKNWKGVK